ncbi:MAG: carboxypeptidase family protein, partial [Gammaproteobacteria bacterium]|nr:carboxypeptidase family protein [Gammaproteobacteria bacterium]
HPGETMAQWFIDGLLSRLLSDVPVASKLLDNCVFYLVPNMNPDGCIRGNHRTNGNGLNLNRQWANPSKIQCPEVFYVRQALHRYGVDMFLDVHGDEEIPYNFMMGGGSNCQLKQQVNLFKNNFANASSDFQDAIDYDTFHKGQSSCCGSSCGKPSLAKASSYVEGKFSCLSMVLEMPFIDNANNPDKETGWSAQRSIRLGESILEPILRWTESRYPRIE